MDIEEAARIIVDSPIQVHRSFGPGLLESAYQRCLSHLLTKRGLMVECEVTLPIVFDGENIDPCYRIDMLVNKCIIIENKTMKQILPIHEAQLLTYMRLSQIKLGFLLNWKVTLMKYGIKRMVL